MQSSRQIISSFAAGEVSPKLYGRVDLPIYQQACRTMQNVFPLPEGPAEKRPGTKYVCEVDSSALAGRLIPWVVTPTSGRVLIMNNSKVQYVNSSGLIYNGTSKVETTIPYATTELWNVRYVQPGSKMYLTHTSHAPRRLTRTSDTSWAITAPSFAHTNNDFQAANSGAGTIFATTGDYPALCEIYEDRLLFARTVNNPGTFWGSQVSDYEDFDHASGTSSAELATDAWEKTPQAKANNIILWLLAEQALLFGSSTGAWRVGGKETLLSPDQAWWPTIQSAAGCSDIAPVLIDDIAVFVERGDKHIRQMQYSQDVDRYLTPQLSQHAEHLTGKGIVEIAFQRNPRSILWVVTEDGTLLSMTFDRASGVVAWSRHTIGSGVVESVCVIPTDGPDDVYLLVKRTINEATKRYVEKFNFDDFSSSIDGYFVDCGTTDHGDSVSVTSITAANPAVCTTAAAHGFENDDHVRFTSVEGITEVNSYIYTVKNKTATTFQLYTQDGGTAIDFSGESEAASGGTVEQVTNTISSLDHLEGETVKILADGGTLATEAVSSGSITLDEFANKVHVGLPYTAKVETMDIQVAPGALKRITKAYFRFYQSVDVQVGPDEDNLETVTLSDELPVMDDAPGLVSGIVESPFYGDHTLEPRFMFVSSSPHPLTVLSVFTEIKVEQHGK
jgi:hypothetical protein